MVAFSLVLEKVTLKCAYASQALARAEKPRVRWGWIYEYRLFQTLCEVFMIMFDGSHFGPDHHLHDHCAGEALVKSESTGVILAKTQKAQRALAEALKAESLRTGAISCAARDGLGSFLDGRLSCWLSSSWLLIVPCRWARGQIRTPHKRKCDKIKKVINANPRNIFFF